MANNKQLVLELGKDKILGLTINHLSTEDIELVFNNKASDTSVLFRERALAILLNEANLLNISDFQKYLINNNYLDLVFRMAEKLIFANKIKDYQLLIENVLKKNQVKPNPRIEKNLNFLKYLAKLLSLLHNAAPLAVNDPEYAKNIEMFHNFAKQFMQVFGDINSNIILLDRVDNALIKTYVSYFRIQLQQLKSSDDKANVLRNLGLEIKSFLQRNLSFTNIRLKKLEERLKALQAKLNMSISKTMQADLIKRFQIYTRYNSELCKLELNLQKIYLDPRSDDNSLLELHKQIIAKVTEINSNLTDLKKVPAELKKDLSNYLLLNEEFNHMYTRMYHLKRINDNLQPDLGSIAGQIAKLEQEAGTLFLYRADQISYQLIYSYLDTKLTGPGDSAEIFLNSKVGLGISYYLLPGQTPFIGNLTLRVQKKPSEKYKLSFSGYLLYDAKKPQRSINQKFGKSFLLSDLDDVVKFIMRGFKPYDFFERLPAINKLIRIS